MIKEWLRPGILGAITVLFYTLLISACSPSEPSFHESETPLRLSAWKLLTIDGDALIPHPSSLVFRPANQLFTDYAHKLRTLWIPTGSQARLVNGEIDYPPRIGFDQDLLLSSRPRRAIFENHRSRRRSNRSTEESAYRNSLAGSKRIRLEGDALCLE